MSTPSLPSEYYAFHCLLGEGGMAHVYVGEHLQLRKKVAIKVLKQEHRSESFIKAKFMEEARKIASLRHPNIIEVSDLFDQNDMTAIVMEFVDGLSMGQLIRANGALDDEQIHLIMDQLLSALQEVHAKGYIHRDIKPDNILIDKQSTVKLTDFGIAKNTDPNALDRTATGVNLMWGTPRYMAPEQITENFPVTIQSDLYSVGVTLWEMATGLRAYDFPNLQIPLKVAQEELPKSNTVWDTIIAIATDKVPTRRYDSAASFRHAINEVKKNANNVLEENRKKLLEDEKMSRGFKLFISGNAPDSSIKKNKVRKFDYFFLSIILLAISLPIITIITNSLQENAVTIEQDIILDDVDQTTSVEHSRTLRILYAKVVSEGYGGDFQDFIKLIREEDAAFEDIYKWANEKGYVSTKHEFAFMIGRP